MGGLGGGGSGGERGAGGGEGGAGGGEGGAPSNRSIPLNKLYVKHETEKKVKYEDRIVQVEKGSFCPLVFSTSDQVV